MVHQGNNVHHMKLVPDAIRYNKLWLTFKALCDLLSCGGALDCTFVPIKKPAEYRDTYFVTNNVIIVLGCVDRDLYVQKAGRPVSGCAF